MPNTPFPQFIIHSVEPSPLFEAPRIIFLGYEDFRNLIFVQVINFPATWKYLRTKG